MPDMLSIREAANDLHMSVKTLRRHIDNGNIDYVVTGLGEQRRRIAFPPDYLAAFKRDRTKREAPKQEGIAPCRSSRDRAARFGTTSSN